MSLVKFVKGTEANITKLKSSSSVKEGALYVATDTGTMWLGTSATALLQIKDNIDTKYSIGSAAAAGITKLYGSTGAATDGTMTQEAITDAIASATGEASLPSGFPEIKSYDYNVEGSLAMAEVGSAAAVSDDYYMNSLDDSSLTEPSYYLYMRTIGEKAPSHFPRVGDKRYFYLEKTTGTIYRWEPDSSATTGSYVPYFDTLALAGLEDVAVGEYAFDAYYGNIAYRHSTLTSGNPHNVTKEDLGLSEVENKSSETIRGEITKDDIVTSLGFTPINEITGSGAITVTKDEDSNIIISSPTTLPTTHPISILGQVYTDDTSSVSFAKDYNGSKSFDLEFDSGIVASSVGETENVITIKLSVTPNSIGTYTSAEIDGKIETALTMQSF